MTHVTCKLAAKNRDQLRNPMLGNRVVTSANMPNRLGLQLHFVMGGVI